MCYKTGYPNFALSSEKFTKKLVVLLTLCTAQRTQTLSLIKISNIKIDNDGINMVINDITKTSAAGGGQPNLYLPYFEKSEICPARILSDYISFTEKIRNHNDYLLLTLKIFYS